MEQCLMGAKGGFVVHPNYFWKTPVAKAESVPTLEQWGEKVASCLKANINSAHREGWFLFKAMDASVCAEDIQ